MNSRFLLSILFFIIICQCKAETDLKVYYRTFGKGEPILIINGGPGMNSNGFAEIAKKISDLGYMTIIFDQRGTGKSILEKSDSTTVNMDLMAMDIENLRKELKIEKWTIFGHSFGGLLACHYFSKYPESVSKIIFSSSGGVNMNFTVYLSDRLQNNLTQMQRDSLAYYQSKIAKGDTSFITRKKRTDFLANAYVYNKQFANQIADRLMELNAEINGLVVNDLFRINFDYKKMFVKNSTPVLVIQGRNDIISVETAEEIKNSFGNSKLKLLNHCAHYGWLDSPKEYFKTIRGFLKS